MFTGPLSPQSRLSDWYETLEVTDADEPHDPINWDAVTDGRLMLRYPAGECDIMTFSLADGFIAFPADGVIQMSIPQGSLYALPASNYRLILTLDVDEPAEQTVTVLDTILPLT